MSLHENFSTQKKKGNDVLKLLHLPLPFFFVCSIKKSVLVCRGLWHGASRDKRRVSM